MNRTAGFTPCSPDLSHLVHVIAELFQDGVAEVSASGMLEQNTGTGWEEKENPGSVFVHETGIPLRTNPFEGSVVAFDRNASKLTILISLGKPMRVIAEIYGPNGRFVKCLFDRRIERGLTEITGVGRRKRNETFVVLLNSGEGIRSFRIMKL